MHWEVTKAQLWPALRTALWAVGLFALGLAIAHEYDEAVRALLDDHAGLGVAVFVATSVLAVLAPMLSNLPLLPVAVAAWGPAWAAALLLLGWVVGSALSYSLGRHARAWVLQRFPSVQRHADIDRLIHAEHRFGSLILLRATFPVDVLSYALGLFSRSTSLTQTALSTAIGGAPFALLFAWLPVMSAPLQAAVLAASTLLFLAYAAWIWRRAEAYGPVRSDQGPR